MGTARRWNAAAKAGAAAALAAAGVALGPSTAAAEPPADLAPRSELEAAAQELIQPVRGRHVQRSPDGGLELWLITDKPFEQSVAELRRAISSKRSLRGMFTLQNWTYVDADRSGLLELVGGSSPRRLRLTRHLQGSLLQIADGADSSEAPRWLPPFRPQALPLLHGPLNR